MAEAWWVVLILFLKNMFLWYTLVVTGYVYLTPFLSSQRPFDILAQGDRGPNDEEKHETGPNGKIDPQQ